MGKHYSYKKKSVYSLSLASCFMKQIETFTLQKSQSKCEAKPILTQKVKQVSKFFDILASAHASLLYLLHTCSHSACVCVSSASHLLTCNASILVGDSLYFKMECLFRLRFIWKSRFHDAESYFMMMKYIVQLSVYVSCCLFFKR